MGWPRNILLWNLMAALITLGQARPKFSSHASNRLKPDCVGNLMRLSLHEALAVGNQLEVEAINGTTNIALTPSLAAQCGYSMESDPWGNTRIYTSLLACYVDNKNDEVFNIGLALKMYSQSLSEIVTHNVAHTCSYSQWASREILCDRNYMEVSHRMAKTDDAVKGHTQEEESNAVPEASAAHGIWKMTFYTPEPVSMVQREAEQAGYSSMITSKRVVMRSPYNTPETYSEDVAGVPMEVFRVSAYYKDPHGLSVVNMVAACPTGGVLFTDDIISWHVPYRITPLLDGTFKVVEIHMGINGQRLDKAQISTRGYKLATTEFHIIVEIPIGAPDGYFKSHAPDYQYHIVYMVEPMLEVLWTAGNGREDTRYKVLFPITTPLIPRPPRHQDDTATGDRMFAVLLGDFLQDVELRNITFTTGVLTVQECNARGYIVQEHIALDNSKGFSLHVPFDADVVLKRNPELLVTEYVLPVSFGLVVVPEEVPFSHTLELHATLEDVVLPSLTGICDESNFYLSVKYGSQGSNFQTWLGPQHLTEEVLELYNFQENGTHFSLIVPYNAKDTAFEIITSNSIRARADLLLYDHINNRALANLFLACTFPLITTNCYSNGTMTAVAVKVESLNNLTPGSLTLKDTSCKPVFSDDRFAYFSFSIDSCGTTRTFFSHYVMYENEIGHFNTRNSYKRTSLATAPDPEYRQTISCYYVVNETKAISFGYKPRGVDFATQVGQGHFDVKMKLAYDSSYQSCYKDEEFPVTKYLREPLYFDVFLESSDPNLELLLDNCWATLHEDSTSTPSWDIIVDGCENQDDGYSTTFLPVHNPKVEFPYQHKHFSVKMFTFIRDEEVLEDQIYFHCNAVICDSNQMEGICRRDCAYPRDSSYTYPGMNWKGKRDDSSQRLTSSGLIHLKY
ncbi:zona pellucida protein AX 1 [Takifugu flavidus]|uniref:zona pellucida protein AX 1 n=1 Tax=Takifugu flavidus TaxID=433684 RepID=UPI002544135B|nr:zona pellucida protein AX 1 [Takifugu flavidus]